MPSIRKGVSEDAEWLASRLRSADLRELAALTDITPLDALLLSLRSGPSWTCADDAGKPFALYGQGGGAPWMLASDGLEDHWRWFLRNTKRIVADMQGDIPVIANAVDARNTVHIRWIQWAGFTLSDPINSPSGLPFIPFYRRKPCASPERVPSLGW
jgi:hypothetical protein